MIRRRLQSRCSTCHREIRETHTCNVQCPWKSQFSKLSTLFTVDILQPKNTCQRCRILLWIDKLDDSSCALDMPLCHLSTGHRSFAFRGAKLWNSLNDNIKSLKCPKNFRRHFANVLLGYYSLYIFRNCNMIVLIFLINLNLLLYDCIELKTDPLREHE